MIATPTPPITIKTIGVLLTPALYLCEAHRRPSPYPDIADNCAVSTLGELQQPEDNSISSCLIWDIWGFATKDNTGPTSAFCANVWYDAGCSLAGRILPGAVLVAKSFTCPCVIVALEFRNSGKCR